MISFVIDLHNSHNNSVLGIRPKTSLFPNICFDREMHPSERGTATCTGPERINWFEIHIYLLKRIKKTAKK